jgi:hypothetical protein
VAANLGTQLLTLKFSRSDETEADLVGWSWPRARLPTPTPRSACGKKMGQASQAAQVGLASLSTHPSGPDRIRELQANVPKVPQAWISRFDTEPLQPNLPSTLMQGPLAGLRFAAKDNIDALGLPTTAACPALPTSPPRTPRWCKNCSMLVHRWSARPTWTSSPAA